MNSSILEDGVNSTLSFSNETNTHPFAPDGDNNINLESFQIHGKRNTGYLSDEEYISFLLFDEFLLGKGIEGETTK